MLTKFKYLPFFVIIFFQISCSNTHFIPDEAMDLKLKNKGDMVLAMSGDHNLITRPQHFQLGYSPVQHLSIFGSYFNNRIDPNTPNYIFHFYRRHSKTGIGTYYFHPLKKLEKEYSLFKNTAIQRGFLFDAYIGGSIGRFGHTQLTNISFYNFDFRKMFFQTGFHWQGNIGGFSLFYNFGKTDIYKGSVNGGLKDFHLEKVESIIENNRFNTHDVSFSVHLGIKYGKIYFNYNDTFQNSGQINQVPYLANCGIMINIDDVFLRSKNR